MSRDGILRFSSLMVALLALSWSAWIAALPPPHSGAVPQAPAAVLDPVTAKGMWATWMNTAHPNGQAMVNKAKQTGLHAIYIRVASTVTGFYGKPIIDAIVPLAHQNGMQVVAWFWFDLDNPTADAALALQVAHYSPNGTDRVDALTPDIEEESLDQAMADVAILHQTTPDDVLSNPGWLAQARALTQRPFSANAHDLTAFLTGIRNGAGGLQGVGQNYLIAGTSFPDPGNHPEVSYPTLSKYCQVFTPMAYWRPDGYHTPGGVKLYIRAVMAQFAKPQYNPDKRPVSIIGQAYKDSTGSPSGAEETASLEQSKASGAVGNSFYEWFESTPAEWSAIQAYTW